MCGISLCTRGALDPWPRGRSTAALGAIEEFALSDTAPRMRLGETTRDLPSFELPARWTLNVVKEGDGPEVHFKCAIGFDERLELIETTTPFGFEFVASRFTAMFGVVEPAVDRICAEMIGTVYGEPMRLSSFTAERGKLFFDFAGPNFWGAITAF